MSAISDRPIGNFSEMHPKLQAVKESLSCQNCTQTLKDAIAKIRKDNNFVKVNDDLSMTFPKKK
jgi:hypothetical protein